MLLSVEEYEQLASRGDVERDGLQLLLDAAEQAITDRYGPIGSPVTEVIDGGKSYIWLKRPAASITSITELNDGSTPTTLSADDWRLGRDGVSIRRLGTGTNPPIWWSSWSRTDVWWGSTITVESVPADDEAERKRIQLHLVKLDLGYTPGVTAEQIGAWLEQKANNSVWNYPDEREAILGSMNAAYAPGFA